MGTRKTKNIEKTVKGILQNDKRKEFWDCSWKHARLITQQGGFKGGGAPLRGVQRTPTTALLLGCRENVTAGEKLERLSTPFQQNARWVFFLQYTRRSLQRARGTSRVFFSFHKLTMKVNFRESFRERFSWKMLTKNAHDLPKFQIFSSKKVMFFH